MANIFQYPIPDFRQFLDQLSAAKPAQFVNMPHSAIKDEESFYGIQKHLVNYYAGIEPVLSFVDPGGTIFDCIRIEKQFSLRGHDGPVAKAPELPRREQQFGDEQYLPDRRIVQLHKQLVDPFGNHMLGPPGTIPVQRLRLEDLARFATLRDYFRKSAAATEFAMLAPAHKYAFADQRVINIGGGSTLNVWDPAISGTQLMSLSQQWYSAGVGDRRQTVEVGWQVNPGRYRHDQPVFFIYWTADNYLATGCYNLTCNGFVQTNWNWALGGVLAPWSTHGGTQYVIDFTFRLDQDKWWLYAGGDQPANAVGYYPVSIFNGGALTRGATRIVFGGETTGTFNWPPMGGGDFANAGWGHAAYQRSIHYFTPAGAAQNAALTAIIPSPACYTAEVKNYGGCWGETVWFGGPGGTNC